MKKTRLSAFALASVLLLSACSGNAKKTEENQAKANDKEIYKNGVLDYRSSDKPYISIDGKEVTHKDFFGYYDLYAGVIGMQQKLSRNVMDLFVRKHIIDKELEEMKAFPTEAEKSAALKQYMDNVGGEVEYNKYLSALGVTKELFEQNIYNSLNSKKHFEAKKASIQLKNEDVQKFYEENKANIDYVEAKHILVKDENLAKEISKKLKNGEDFEKLNKEHSIDKAAQAKGGNLGKVTASKMDKDFVEGAFKLKEGEISEPVKTKFGYHIIKVDENFVGLDKNKSTIEEQLKMKKYSEEMKEKISKLKVDFFDANGKPINTGKTQEKKDESKNEKKSQ